MVEGAHRLRERGKVAGVLTSGISFVGGSSVTRSRMLLEATAYTDDPRIAAAELIQRPGLQRARVRGIAIRAGRLSGAEAASVQLGIDAEHEAGHRLDPVVEQLGPGTSPGRPWPMATALTRAVVGAPGPAHGPQPGSASSRAA